MAKTVCMASKEGLQTTAGATQYTPFGNGPINFALTETARDYWARKAGTISKLYVKIIANTTTGSSTIRLRKNGANGNLTVTIGAGATGVFTDNSNTDTLDGDDLVNWQVITGGGGVLTFGVIRAVFEASTNTRALMFSTHDGAISAASITRTWPIVAATNGYNVNDVDSQIEERLAGTYFYFAAYAFTNNRSTNTFVRLRVNATSVGILTYSASETGWEETNAGGTAAAVNDKTNMAVGTGTGTGTFLLTVTKVEFETTNNQSRSMISDTGELGISASATKYIPIGGGWTPTSGHTTENDVKAPLGFKATIRGLAIYVQSNPNTGNSVITLRKNNSNTSITITVASGVTGWVEDMAHTELVEDTDDLDISITGGASGSALSIVAAEIIYEEYIVITGTNTTEKDIANKFISKA